MVRKVLVLVVAIAVVGIGLFVGLHKTEVKHVYPKVNITVPVSNGYVNPNATIGIAIQNARIMTLVVKTQSGTIIQGKLVSSQGDSTNKLKLYKWTPVQWMAWDTKFDLSLKARGGEPALTLSKNVSFQTPLEPLPAGTVNITVSPSKGQQVGMGATWVVQFSTPIPVSLQQEILSRLNTTESIVDPVGWHWWSQTEVDGRPENFWPLNENATLSVNLDGLVLNGQRLVTSQVQSSFTVVNQHLTKISALTDQMQVYNGNQLLYTFPVSLGRSGFQTISGTLVVLYKEPVVFMNSATIGFPGIYAENVYLDVAISTDGYYIHSAPWDVYDHGHYNVSFGCVEQNPDHAQWFYNFSQPGDVVIISGTSLQANEAQNGEGDWNIPWSQFQPA